MARGKSRLAAGAIVIAVAGLLGAVLLSGGAGAGTADVAKRTQVKLGDNFFKPTSKSVKKGTRVRFKWTQGNRHNVTLRKGPGKKFASKTTSAKGVNFSRKFKKRGTYKLRCTIHPTQMNLKLKVK